MKAEKFYFNNREKLINYVEQSNNLYAKWDSLNGLQQNAIANAFGGVRQKERFLALMENYDKAKKYMDLSANSAGAAEQKFGAYLDSIEAKSKSLQAAFESLANNDISSELIGNIEEAAAALVTFVDKANLLDGAFAGLLAGGAIKAFLMLKTGIASSVLKLNEFHSAIKLVKAGNIGTAEIEQLGVGTGANSWYYKFQGKTYTSKKAKKEDAISQILSQIEDDNGGRFPASAASIYGTIKHYAKGTRNAKGGVSQVNEEGLETLMKQTPQGDFVVLNQGDQVFTKEQTDNLQEISRKPAKYIYDNVDLETLAKKGLTPLTDEEISNLGLWANYSDVLANLNSRIEIPDLSKKVLENISKNSELGDNINQNIRQNINYYNTNNIHGDVTPQMLRLLEKKEKEIIKKSTENVMDIALSNRKFFRSTLG